MMANMFSLIMKNLITKPPTRLYPTIRREPFERTRGRIYFENKDCIYCGICMRKCPADAIKVDRAKQTWELEPFRCIICGECVVSCPKKTIHMTNERRSAVTKKNYFIDTKPVEPKPAEAQPKAE
jgi:ech hydrogenase subunit F